jgi:hypothetical protein
MSYEAIRTIRDINRDINRDMLRLEAERRAAQLKRLRAQLAQIQFDKALEVIEERALSKPAINMSNWSELMHRSKSNWQLFSWNPEVDSFKRIEYHFRTMFHGHEIIIWTTCYRNSTGSYSAPPKTGKAAWDDTIKVVIPKRFSEHIPKTEDWEEEVMGAVQEARRRILNWR